MVERRTSVRTFNSRALDGEALSRVEAALDGAPAATWSPFRDAPPVRFVLLADEGGDPAEWRKLGTYGMIKGAKYFVVGVTRHGPHDGENYGFVLERLVLEFTAWGLGTCWLGSFKREEFGAKVDLAEGEFVPAITPVGWPAPRRRAFERVVRAVVRAKKRKPWSDLFFSGEFGRPLSPGEAGPFARALEAVRLAPSAKNGQPWRVVKEVGHATFHFHVQAKGGSFTRLDAGIAVCHFELARRALKLDGEWSLDDPGLQKPEGVVHVATFRGVQPS